MAQVTQEQIDQLKARRSKLQFHMEQAIKEKDQIQEELNQLLPDIEKQFGTTDPVELEKISAGLQEKIDAQIQELAEMGIQI